MSKTPLGLLALFAVSALGPPASASRASALVNPGFEADGTGVRSPAGWESVGATDADFTEAGGHVGGFRLSHWSPSAYSVETRQNASAVARGGTRRAGRSPFMTARPLGVSTTTGF